MSQERTDSDCCFSSLTSSGRHTFLIHQSGGKPLLLDTSKASECPRLDSLEETTFRDAFRSKALPEWPPGHDDIDIKLFKIPKIGNNSERRLLYVILHDKVLRCSGSESGPVGRWLTWLIPPLPSFFTQFFQNYMLTSSSTKDCQNEMPILSNELLQSLSEVDENIPMETSSSEPIKEARMIFSSPACLNASFPMAGPHGDDDLDIDLEAARKAFKLIASKEILLEWIAEVVTNDMCRTIQLEQLTDMDLQFFFILLECPIFHYPQFPWCRKVLTALGKLLISGHGKRNVLSRLERWWAYEPASFHGTVATYRGAISMLAENSVLQANEQDNFKTYLNVLQCLHEINIKHDIIDFKTFYLTHLNASGLEEDLERSMQHQPRWRVSKYFLSFIQAERFSWISYPFLIDLKTKAYLLESRCKREQKNAMETKVDIIRRGIMQCIQQEFPGLSPNSLEFSIISDMFEVSCNFVPPPRLNLVVNRDDIFGGRVRQQLSEMLTRPRTDRQMPLMVVFEGEDGIDEGALSLEFFRLVFHDLLDPEKHDIFRYIDEEDPTQSQVWFREECSSIDNAKICGLLLGLSLYNKAFVPIPAFPQVLYAKLLGKGPGSEMEELEKLDKEFADQMKKLLDSSEEEVQGICYGEEIELDDGRLVDVTKENVRLYVEKKIRHYLAPSQFAAFKDGFYSLWDAKILGIFRPVEFEALINGKNYFDWKDLETSTRYLEPYTDSHLTIRMFWECFHALDDGQKRKFLVFVAGTDRVPVGGLKDFHLTIAELPIPEDAEGTPEERLSLLCPMAHCCDNNQYNRTLELPMYTSREMVEDRLGTALSMYNIPFHIA
ncbi:probable E3 ubiquitin-protein ligase HERC4 [Lytechinus variegatus]|uniref:probable E3 ubiquitin-protein ligase HERC4 n=1 Tax=Lytechinus variegatus TaxID=7654 RepID=UPI001BB1C080|nr:probable E3 ubiquitin-protein ligase HERC4 [Lytechinus variegatus]